MKIDMGGTNNNYNKLLLTVLTPNIFTQFYIVDRLAVNSYLI